MTTPTQTQVKLSGAEIAALEVNIRLGRIGRAGSRFDGRALPILHERKRCVPPRQNYLRRICIRVFFMATAGANKARLALATSFVDVAARRACAGGIAGRNLNQLPAPFFKFVGQQGFEDMPTLIENRPVETALSIAAGGHVPGLKVFNNDSAEPIGKFAAGTVVPVGANASATGCKLGNTNAGFGISLRPALPAGQNSLRTPLTTLKDVKAGRNRDQFTRAQRKRVGNATINAGRRSDVRGRLMLDLKSERDMPAVRREMTKHTHTGEHTGDWKITVERIKDTPNAS